MLACCRGSNSENWRRMEGPQYRRSAIRSTSFPGFSRLPREITLVAAGHVTPKMWEPTMIYLMGGNCCCGEKRHKIQWTTCKLERIAFTYTGHQTTSIAKVFSPHHTFAFYLNIVLTVVDLRKASSGLKSFDSSWRQSEG